MSAEKDFIPAPLVNASFAPQPVPHAAAVLPADRALLEHLESEILVHVQVVLSLFKLQHDTAKAVKTVVYSAILQALVFNVFQPSN